MMLLALFNYPFICVLRFVYSLYLGVVYPHDYKFGKRLILMQNFNQFIVERPIITTIFSVFFYKILFKILC